MSKREIYLEAERVRRAQEAFERDLVEMERRRNATPQTMRHRQIAVVDELFNRDRMSVDQLRAAHEINAVLEAVTCGLSMRTSSFEFRERRTYSGDDWKPGLSRAYEERYIPWRDEAGKMALRSKASVADLVLDVIVSNLGLHQAGKMWGMDPRRVLSVLRNSLYRYCEIAGWVSVQQSTLDIGVSYAE